MGSSTIITHALEKTLVAVAPAAKTVLWPIFGIVFVVYVVVSLVLLYHWRRYSLHNKRIAFAEVTYFVVSAIALAIAVFAIMFI